MSNETTIAVQPVDLMEFVPPYLRRYCQEHSDEELTPCIVTLADSELRTWLPKVIAYEAVMGRTFYYNNPYELSDGWHVTFRSSVSTYLAAEVSELLNVNVQVLIARDGVASA